MAAKIRQQIGKVWIEVDASTVVDGVRELALWAEVFSETCCGACKSVNIRPFRRTNSNNDEYFYLRCIDCDKQLDLGQHKKGDTLFIKRQPKDIPQGKVTNGWYHWRDNPNLNSSNSENSGGF